MSILVVNLRGWCHPVWSVKILETNVGNSTVSIVGEGTHVDVGCSVHVVHGALSDVEHAVVARVLGLVKSDASLSPHVVDGSEVLELGGVDDNGLHFCVF